jgi:hypothetical protein
MADMTTKSNPIVIGDLQQNSMAVGAGESRELADLFETRVDGTFLPVNPRLSFQSARDRKRWGCHQPAGQLD